MIRRLYLSVIYDLFEMLSTDSFRYESNSGGEREIQRTMLELLNQLDGFDSKGDVKVSEKIVSHTALSFRDIMVFEDCFPSL